MVKKERARFKKIFRAKCIRQKYVQYITSYNKEKDWSILRQTVLTENEKLFSKYKLFRYQLFIIVIYIRPFDMVAGNFTLISIKHLDAFWIINYKFIAIHFIFYQVYIMRLRQTIKQWDMLVVESPFSSFSCMARYIILLKKVLCTF